MTVSGAAIEWEQHQLITDLSVDQSTERNADPSVGMIIYYAESGESVWDIAKRYRTDAELISEKNALEPTLTPDSPDSLGNAKFLII